jgi:hypothetical protein
MESCNFAGDADNAAAAAAASAAAAVVITRGPTGLQLAELPLRLLLLHLLLTRLLLLLLLLLVLLWPGVPLGCSWLSWLSCHTTQSTAKSST